MNQGTDFIDFSSVSDVNKQQEQCGMPLLTNSKFPYQFSPFCNKISYKFIFALTTHFKTIADALFL
jgi:hypothetical protein